MYVHIVYVIYQPFIHEHMVELLIFSLNIYNKVLKV